MTQMIEVVYLEPSESVRFLTNVSSGAADYIVYASTSSVLPGSYDQVLRNHILPLGVTPNAAATAPRENGTRAA